MNYYGSGMNQQNAMGGVAHNPEGMRNALAPAVEKARNVQTLLEALEQRMTMLQETVGALEKRLDPVLYCEPESKNTEAMHASPTGSPVMNEISRAIGRAEYITDVLASILRRVTL